MSAPRLKYDTLTQIAGDSTLALYSTGYRVAPSVGWLLKNMAQELLQRRDQDTADEPALAPNPRMHNGPASRPPRTLARREDPWTSKAGAERIEPKRNTRKAEVLETLRKHRGDWVPGSMLATVTVGGSEGLRRLRELRMDQGWPIERRPSPENATMFEYRLPEEEKP